METLEQALKRIVKERDFSLNASTALESVIAKTLPEDERLEELVHILASYRPGGGEFIFNESQLERECVQVMNILGIT